MTKEMRGYLGHGVSIAFDGHQFRLFGYRNAIPFNIFLDQDALDKFQAFVELVEQAEAH
jgi:tetrahydromethanopterin S-methyltransferase subunit A